jgi:hypothetical protein
MCRDPFFHSNAGEATCGWWKSMKVQALCMGGTCSLSFSVYQCKRCFPTGAFESVSCRATITSFTRSARFYSGVLRAMNALFDDAYWKSRHRDSRWSDKDVLLALNEQRAHCFSFFQFPDGGFYFIFNQMQEGRTFYCSIENELLSFCVC